MNLEILKLAETVKVEKIEDLGRRLSNLMPDNSPSNILTIAKLIEDITFYLVSLNTNNQKDLHSFFNFGSEVMYLLQPLINSGYIKMDLMSPVAYPIDSPNPTIISLSPTYYILPAEDIEIVKEIESQVQRFPKHRKSVEINNTLIHLHSDVVKPLKPFGTDRPYIIRNQEPLQDILLGRGTSDEKSQIASTIVTLFLMEKLNEKPPFILLTSDEELGSPASQHILASMSAPLSIDPEPSRPDLYGVESYPYTVLKIILKPNSWLEKKTRSWKDQDIVCQELRNLIKAEIEKKYPPERYEMIIDNVEHVLYISILDKTFAVISEVDKTTRQNVLNLISRERKILSADEAIYTSNNSYIDKKTKPMLEEVFTRRNVSETENLGTPITYTVQTNTDSREAHFRHNFDTALRSYLGKKSNIIVFGPRDKGIRHTRVEAVLTEDLIIFTKNLLEILCGGKEVFKEG